MKSNKSLHHTNFLNDKLMLVIVILTVLLGVSCLMPLQMKPVTQYLPSIQSVLEVVSTVLDSVLAKTRWQRKISTPIKRSRMKSER